MVLSLAFDGATRTVQTAISVDGGATFQTPFSPQPYFAEVNSARLMLGADPLADAQRAGGPLCSGGSAIANGSVVVRKRKAGGLVIRGTIPRPADDTEILQWPRDGLQLRILDHASASRCSISPG